MASTNNLLTRYFRDNMKPSICVQFDDKDFDLDDWQRVFKQAIDIKTKVV